MPHYSQFIAYSPLTDCDVARISMANEQGSEYFCLLPVTEGKAWRDAKQEALSALSEAITDGLRPGEIRWR